MYINTKLMEKIMSEKSAKIDHGLMWPGVIVTGIIGIILSIFPESGRAVVDSLFAILTHNFKWLFLIFGLFCVVFLVWLALSRWGTSSWGTLTTPLSFPPIPGRP